jgi:hypothetical protein
MVPDEKSKALQCFYYGQKKIRKLHNYLSVPNHSRKKNVLHSLSAFKKRFHVTKENQIQHYFTHMRI